VVELLAEIFHPDVAATQAASQTVHRGRRALQAAWDAVCGAWGSLSRNAYHAGVSITENLLDAFGIFSRSFQWRNLFGRKLLRLGDTAPFRVMLMLADVLRSTKVRNIGAVAAFRCREFINGREELWPIKPPSFEADPTDPRVAGLLRLCAPHQRQA